MTTAITITIAITRRSIKVKVKVKVTALLCSEARRQTSGREKGLLF